MLMLIPIQHACILLTAKLVVPSCDDDACGERVPVIVAHFAENVGGGFDERRFAGLNFVEAQMIFDHVRDSLSVSG